MFKLFKYLGDHKKYAILAPVLVAIEVLFDVLIPNVMSSIIDVGINGENGANIGYILLMGGLMILMSLFAMVTGALSGRTSAYAGAGFVRNLRSALFNKIQDFSFKNIDHFSVPSLVTRLTTDMRQIRMAFMMIIRMLVRAPLQLIFSFIMVARINLKLAIVFVVAIPVLGLGLFLISYKAHPRFVVMMEKYDDLNASLEENLVGIRVVKTFVRQEHEKDKFNLSSNNVMKQQRFAEKIVILNQPFFEFIMYLCMIAVSWFGGKFIIDGTLSVGTFMSYLTYIKMILFALLQISFCLMQVVMAQASLRRVNELFDEKIDITDENADESIKVEEGSIVFENVNFKYAADAEKYVLSGVNLTINPGEMVGIIGPTGASKSTLVNLIPRFYDTTEGRVLVSGHDVRDYKIKNLRDGIGMVLQKNVLFSGTITDNLRWGNENATMEEVIEASKCAQADDFVSAFPEGYDTKIDQGGVNVSGGQKQRLCIARALLKKPKIIIMDDSTSAVDTDTDRRIRTALKEKLSGMTTIIIAQRISSVMDADKILIMEDGLITDMGTHSELLERCTSYRELYESQTQGVE